jgi:hypothetical protein
MRKKLLFAGLFTLLSLLLVAVFAGTGTDYFTEDFSSRQYCNTSNTTALWDTVSGELKLPPFELTLAGSYATTGSARGVTVEGDYAYVVSMTAGLQVVDISDPESPSLAGSYDTPGYAFGVAISGDYAYVADESYGLQVIDISDPTIPSLAGNYDTPAGAYSVAIAGDYAYVGDWTSGLQVIDISDPTNPSLAGSCDTPGNALGVAIAGDYAYVADYTSGLQVIDISDPTSPSLAGGYDTPGNAWVAIVAGDYAYVADQVSGFEVIDISDPTNPTLAGSYNTPGAAYGISIAGDHAYVADYTSGLQVIDISDPTSPSLMDSYDTPGHAYAVTVSCEHAYVADYGSGLQVIDISDPVGPLAGGSCAAQVSARSVVVSGDYAYVPDYTAGLSVVDISDPTNPSYAGSCDTDHAEHVTISGDYAYVADYTSGLQVIDISDPTSPSLEGNYNTTGIAYGVYISGDHAYVADGSSGLKVIGISDPTSPALAGSYNTPGSAQGIVVAGDHAYVADGSSGLQVIDISDPTSPTLAGSYDTPGSAQGIVVAGDYAYVADASSGLQVIDVSDPASPTLAGSYDTPGTALDVAISGDFAYLADHPDLLVIDISDPTSPSPLESYQTPGYAFGISVSGDFAYVADATSGLQVIQVHQRMVDASANIAYSTLVHTYSYYILAARITTAQTDSIKWYINVTPVLPGASWTTLPYHIHELYWNSRLVYRHPNINPVCSEITIEVLGAFPLADSITDIPNDQGRQVSISWTRSGYDYADYGGSTTPITEYAIYRRIDYDLSMSIESKGPGTDGDDIPAQEDRLHPPLTYPPGDWHFIMTVPARCEDTYAAVVPTLADSTISEGMYYTTFFVRARTETPGVYFDSEPDSGYSADNLAPGMPMGFAVAYNTGSGTELAWEECSDTDFDYFCVYRSESEDFEPDPGNRVHMTTDTGWLDTVEEGWRYHYKITAVDFSGNESGPASAEAVTGDDMPTAPTAFALYQNVPNPFNPTTLIRFDLPVRSHVRLGIYNVKGQLVRAILDQEIDEGRSEVGWDGTDSMGKGVASGIYFYRLDTPVFGETRKMILLR